MRLRMLLILVLALVGASCTTSIVDATETTATTPGPDEGFPVTVSAYNGEVEIANRPDAIVSLSPSTTEILFAIGAGDQVIAVDEFSDYPADAPTTALSGFTPNVEAIADFEPDLVVLSFDPGSIEAGLNALGIPVIVHFSAFTLSDSYTQIEQLGAVTGHVAEAAGLVGRMRSTLDAAVAEFDDAGPGLTYYHELDDTYYTATSQTFVGELYGLLGLVNIADPQDIDGFGFPQLSPEYIIESDPDLIFLADTKCCGQTASSVADRPGWDNLRAVTTAGVIELDDDIASRWGPRIVDFVEAIAAAVRNLETASGG